MDLDRISMRGQFPGAMDFLRGNAASNGEVPPAGAAWDGLTQDQWSEFVKSFGIAVVSQMNSVFQEMARRMKE